VVEDPDNQPPELDWKLSTPEGFEYAFDRSTGQSVEFSIANATWDPEDDKLNFIWYREIPDSDDGGPVPVVGKLSMTLDPCEIYSLRNAAGVNVAVWVSDESLDFDKDEEPFPIIYGTRPPVARFWTVELLGECP